MPQDQGHPAQWVHLKPDRLSSVLTVPSQSVLSTVNLSEYARIWKQICYTFKILK